jgi:hypothetical protein
MDDFYSLFFGVDFLVPFVLSKPVGNPTNYLFKHHHYHPSMNTEALNG